MLDEFRRSQPSAEEQGDDISQINKVAVSIYNFFIHPASRSVFTPVALVGYNTPVFKKLGRVWVL